MEIKNFFLSQICKYSWPLLCVLVVSCTHEQKKSTSPHKTSPPPTETPVGITSPTQQDEQPKAAPQTSNKIPKIGLILGPGGIKTFAHLGVLREFEKNNIPIHSIIGLEWGSLIGALYSMNGKANDVEWQLSKLKRSDLPEKSLLSSGLDPASPKNLATYLGTVFNDKKIENSTLPFSCPSMLLGNGKVAWWAQGSLKSMIAKCMAFPPLYKSSQGWVAAPFEVEAAAQKLRDGGAEVIIFVNVLARGLVLKENRIKDDDQVQIIWWEGIEKLNASAKAVDWLVGIHTRGYDVLDFDARQSFIMFGHEFGEVAAKRIATQYGL